ncbi:hypothetical protein B0H14DRAFT_3099267 [Mycena olivaceomarginata]|nr:hypothetical protein B0H14DRAFT_3099267 [Mycena olivaceomarginata]
MTPRSSRSLQALLRRNSHAIALPIIKSEDQQPSIFRRKLEAGPEDRARIVDAICADGGDTDRNDTERRQIVACMRGRINSKALECEEEVCLLIVSELLWAAPATTLVNKHASHMWSKITELSWTPPAPPIFAYVNMSLKGKWTALAYHETGSLVPQDGIIDELLAHGAAVFGEVAKSQWGSYCIQHTPLAALLEFATNEQVSKSVVKALKKGGKETLDRVVQPVKGARRAIIAKKDRCAALYDCIRAQIVPRCACKTGCKVIWLFDRMRA